MGGAVEQGDEAGKALGGARRGWRRRLVRPELKRAHRLAAYPWCSADTRRPWPEGYEQRAMSGNGEQQRLRSTRCESRGQVALPVGTAKRPLATSGSEPQSRVRGASTFGVANGRWEVTEHYHGGCTADVANGSWAQGALANGEWPTKPSHGAGVERTSCCRTKG